MDQTTRALLARAIRDHAPDRAQVGGKTVTPEDAAEAIASISDPQALLALAHTFAELADTALLSAEKVGA
jgi:hypothetical protein